MRYSPTVEMVETAETDVAPLEREERVEDREAAGQ
jgi:hypothetical protein